MVARSRSAGRTARRRGVLAALLLGLVLVTGACRLTVGCRVYSLWEPGAATPLQVDDSACEVPPAPVVPEVPLPVVLPVAVAGTVAVVGRRQVTRRRRETGSV